MAEKIYVFIKRFGEAIKPPVSEIIVDLPHVNFGNVLRRFRQSNRPVRMIVGLWNTQATYNAIGYLERIVLARLEHLNNLTADQKPDRFARLPQMKAGQCYVVSHSHRNAVTIA